MLKSKSRYQFAFVLFALALTVFSCASPMTTAPVLTGTNAVTANSPTSIVSPTATPTATITSSPTVTPTITATPVPRLFAKVISAGSSHTCAVTLSGGAKCWGHNDAGELGDGTRIDRSTPVDVVGLTSGVADISTGENFTCALMTSGGVKCWGSNFYFTLGNGSPSHEASLVPVDVKGLSSGVISISSGFIHACALLRTGGVKCWGENGFGQLGNSLDLLSNVPVDVIGLSSGVIAINAGHSDHTCALMKTGGVKCWGDNRIGQLGNEIPYYPKYQLVDVKGLSSGVIAIAAAEYHTCALMETGGIKCWGENDGGELGDGTKINRLAPVDVVDLNGPVSAISAGGSSTCALMQTVGVKCWGQNISYTGHNDLFIYTPVDIDGLESGVSAISVGLMDAFIIMADGSVKCWGANAYGELGIGSLESILPPPVDVICPNCGSTGPGATIEPTATPG
jgi:alpha-tubulin suppressor-like RCC1 family protein